MHRAQSSERPISWTEPVQCEVSRPLRKHELGHTNVSPQPLPGNTGRTEPSSVEPTPEPTTLDTEPSGSSILDLHAQARYDAAPRWRLAAVRGLLGQLVPGRTSRSRPRRTSGPDASAGEALQVALGLTPVGRLGGGRATVRSASAPTSEPPTQFIPRHAGPASNSEKEPKPRATIAETAGTASVEPGAVRLAAPPALATELTTPREDLEERSSAPRRLRQHGDTAPDFLLQSPTSLTVAADHFFDGLVRRAESDR